VILRFGSKLKIAKVLDFETVERSDIIPETTIKKLKDIKPISIHPDKYIYIVARAVSAGEYHGPNDNGDFFEWEELLKRYRTFIGAAVNLDHKNNKKEYAVGMIVDALPNEDGKWIEIVMAIDVEKAEQIHPGIIDDITNGVVTDVSMGCLVDESICSVCLEEVDGDISRLSKGRGIALDPEDFCDHVREDSPIFCKGGEYHGIPCFEINRGVTFFEESIITTKGADPDAKILARLASKFSKSPLEQYINFRAISMEKIANYYNQLTKGDHGMKNTKIAAGKDVDTSQEKPDYGSGHAKDEELKDQSKQKSDKENARGTQVQTQSEKPDYLLAALKDLKKVVSTKNDKMAIAALLGIAAEDLEDKDEEKKEEGADEDSEEVIDENKEDKEKVEGEDEVGEKPEKVEEMEDEMEEKAQMGVPTPVSPLPPPVQPAVAAKKKKVGKEKSKLTGIESRPSGITANVNAIVGDFLKKLAAVGGEVSWIDDNPDTYGAASEKDKAYKSEADKGASETERNKKAEDAAGNATPEERQKVQDVVKKQASVGKKAEDEEDKKDEKEDEKKEASVKQADNEDKKIDYIVDQMATGRSYEDCSGEADEKYEEKREGSLKKKAEGDNSESRMKDGTEETKSSPASISEAEKENDMQKKELDAESAGSVTDKPEVEKKISTAADDKDEKKEDKKEEKEAAEEEDKKDEDKEKKEAAEEDKENKKEAAEESDQAKDIMDEKKETAEDKDEDEDKKEEAQFADTWEGTGEKADEEMEKEVKATIDDLDGFAQSNEGQLGSMAEEAETFASIKMNDEAKVAVKRIAGIKVTVKSLNAHANKLEGQLDQYKQLKSTAAKKIGRKAVSKSLVAARKDLKNMVLSEKEEFKKIENTRKVASTIRSLIKEREAAKNKARITEASLKSHARSKAISNLIKVAEGKGLVVETDRDNTIKRWASLTDERFEGVKMAIDSAPGKVVRASLVNKQVRSAMDGLRRVDEGSNKLMDPINSIASSNDRILEEAFMEGVHPERNPHGVF